MGWRGAGPNGFSLCILLVKKMKVTPDWMFEEHAADK